MSPNARYNLSRTLVALAVAFFALCVLIPFLYDIAGVRTDLEEAFAPTLVSQIARKTRIPAPPAFTITPSPRATIVPPTATPSAPLPTVSALNGISVQKLVFISDSAREHIHTIFALGQSLGRNPHTLSKVGDSTMVYPAFLDTFDHASYRLGKFGYLQPTIDAFANSFGRTSVAVKKGMHTWSQFDPTWAIPELCAPEEGPLACEVRLENPSIAIIRLGANDTDFPGEFERNLGAIIKYCLARGIIPILGTKPDRYEGSSNLINNIIRKTASAYSLPLWDYDLIAGTVPERGLEPDHLHIKGGGTRDFTSRAAMQEGDALEDLTALIMLDAVRHEMSSDPATEKKPVISK